MRDVSKWEPIQENRGSRKGWWLQDPDTSGMGLLKFAPRKSSRGLEFEYAEAGAEALAAGVGRLLEIDVPDVEVVRFKGSVCCLSWNFVGPPFQFREGTDLLNTLADDRRVFHLEDVLRALAPHLGVEEAKRHLTYLACFDILIGNPDRHQGNWGVLVSTSPAVSSRMAPYYDNGAAFGSNLDPLRVRSYLDDGHQRERFDRRFQYCMGVQPGAKARIGELLDILMSWDRTLYSFAERLDALTDDRLTTAVDSIHTSALPEERKQLAYILLRRRRMMIRERVATHGT